MSFGEYQAIMKEMGSSTTTTTRPPAGSSSSPANNANDQMLAQITLRLDEKWERFAANVAVQCLDLAKHVVHSLQVVAYAASACLVLYGTSCVIRALRENNHDTTTSKRRRNPNDETLP